MAPYLAECALEDEPGFSDVGDLVRMYVLVTLFAGDPDLWMSDIDQMCQGRPDLQADLAFLIRVKGALRADSSFGPAMETLVAGIRDVLRELQTASN